VPGTDKRTTSSPFSFAQIISRKATKAQRLSAGREARPLRAFVGIVRTKKRPRISAGPFFFSLVTPDLIRGPSAFRPKPKEGGCRIKPGMTVQISCRRGSGRPGRIRARGRRCSGRSPPSRSRRGPPPPQSASKSSAAAAPPDRVLGRSGSTGTPPSSGSGPRRRLVRRRKGDKRSASKPDRRPAGRRSLRLRKSRVGIGPPSITCALRFKSGSVTCPAAGSFAVTFQDRPKSTAERLTQSRKVAKIQSRRETRSLRAFAASRETQTKRPRISAEPFHLIPSVIPDLAPAHLVPSKKGRWMPDQVRHDELGF